MNTVAAIHILCVRCVKNVRNVFNGFDMLSAIALRPFTTIEPDRTKHFSCLQREGKKCLQTQPLIHLAMIL